MSQTKETEHTEKSNGGQSIFETQLVNLRKSLRSEKRKCHELELKLTETEWKISEMKQVNENLRLKSKSNVHMHFRNQELLKENKVLLEEVNSLKRTLNRNLLEEEQKTEEHSKLLDDWKSIILNIRSKQTEVEKENCALQSKVQFVKRDAKKKFHVNLKVLESKAQTLIKVVEKKDKQVPLLVHSLKKLKVKCETLIQKVRINEAKAKEKQEATKKLLHELKTEKDLTKQLKSKLATTKKEKKIIKAYYKEKHGMNKVTA